MKKVINKVTLTGFAGADAEVKALPGNLKLARVNISVNETYKNSLGEDIRKTQWFTLTFWDANADIAEAEIKNGTWFSVEGRLQTNNYESFDGIKRLAVEILVQKVRIIQQEEPKI